MFPTEYFRGEGGHTLSVLYPAIPTCSSALAACLSTSSCSSRLWASARRRSCSSLCPSSPSRSCLSCWSSASCSWRRRSSSSRFWDSSSSKLWVKMYFSEKYAYGQYQCREETSLLFSIKTLLLRLI